LNLVQNPRFIQDDFSNETDFCYKEIAGGTVFGSIFEVSCYAHMYNTGINNVTYFIDDQYVGMANEIPYTTYIDATNFSGAHTLKAVCEFKNGKKLEKECEVLVYNNNSDIAVEIFGKKIEFDQNPVLYKDRTMVPVRRIFEELGAKVSWDNTTQTVIATKGDKIVKLSIGKRIMYVGDEKIFLDVSPIIISNRTLVPARAVAEGFGCRVDWRDGVVLIT